MSGKDLFEALLKLLAIWRLILGGRHLIYAGYYAVTVDISSITVGDYLLPATFEILVGLFLLAMSRKIAEACYRNRN